jgi:predicted nucleic acid-binding protein
MSVPEFLDTNILVYAYDISDPAKQRTAQELLRRAIAGEIVLSTQVLAEFAATLLHKITPAATPEQLMQILDALGPIPLVPTDADMIRRALEARAAYGLHFWDCMIVAAAERAGCERIWSEDLNAGEEYFGAVVANPFR